MSVVDAIRRERVVAVLRRTAEPEQVVAALRAGGIRIVEVTLDSSGALETIGRLRRDSGLVVLAGTVRTPAEVDEASRAGAQGCVAPVLVHAVIERCKSLGLPVIPGALTPSEIEAAWRLDVEMVKLFP